MADKCPDCERPAWTEAAEDMVAVCFCQGDANCELACQLRASEAEVARLEALFQRTQGVGVHHSWVAKAQEATRLEVECERLRREVKDTLDLLGRGVELMEGEEALRSRIAKLEAAVEAQAKVIAAADVLAAGEGSPCEMASAYDAAKAELEKVR